MKIPLKPGDRVLVKSVFSQTGVVERCEGEVKEIFTSDGVEIVKLDDGQFFRAKACRLKPKAAKEKRVERLSVTATINNGSLSIRFNDSLSLGPDRAIPLVEMRPGERVLSREELARVWKKHTHFVSVVGDIEFEAFCKALGFAGGSDGE